jgi:hypothetical protein
MQNVSKRRKEDYTLFNPYLTVENVQHTSIPMMEELEEIPIVQELRPAHVVEKDAGAHLALVDCKTVTAVDSTFQIHIVPRNFPAEKIRAYVVVVLFKRVFAGGPAVVGCCSLCDSSSHFLRMCTAAHCAAVTYNLTLPCKHVKVAMEQSCFNAGVRFGPVAFWIWRKNCLRSPQKQLDSGRLDFWLELFMRCMCMSQLKTLLVFL